MSRTMISGAAIIIAAALILVYVTAISGKNRKTQNVEKSSEYAYPSFYKGFYLTSESANSLNKLSSFLERGKTAGLNTVVMDIQTPSMKNSVTPAEHIALCLSKGFHPVARLVMFPDGLKEYPIPAELMEARLSAAEAACKAGYKEIQLDYIRFNDHGILKKLSVKEKYEIVKKVVNDVKGRVNKYNVRIAVDIFGRIPLNIDDPIGQKMEVFDEIVDVICPMAYPSHYTWSNKMMKDPYYTVHLTSVKAKSRVKNSIIVPWIQAFQIKVKFSGLSYEDYVEQQIKAVYDAGVNGYIFWNASQEYTVPFAAAVKYDSRQLKIAVKQ